MSNIINFVQKNMNEDVPESIIARNVLKFIRSFDPEKFNEEFDRFNVLTNNHVTDYDNPHHDTVYVTTDQFIEGFYEFYKSSVTSLPTGNNFRFPTFDEFSEILKRDVNILICLRNLYVAVNFNRNESSQDNLNYGQSPPCNNEPVSEQVMVAGSLPETQSRAFNSFDYHNVHIPRLEYNINNRLNANFFKYFPRFNDTLSIFNYDDNVKSLFGNHSNFTIIPDRALKLDPDLGITGFIHLNRNNHNVKDGDLNLIIGMSRYKHAWEDEVSGLVSPSSTNGANCYYHHYPSSGIGLKINTTDNIVTVRLCIFTYDPDISGDNMSRQCISLGYLDGGGTVNDNDRYPVTIENNCFLQLKGDISNIGFFLNNTNSSNTYTLGICSATSHGLLRFSSEIYYSSFENSRLFNECGNEDYVPVLNVDTNEHYNFIPHVNQEYDHLSLKSIILSHRNFTSYEIENILTSL